MFEEFRRAFTLLAYRLRGARKTVREHAPRERPVTRPFEYFAWITQRLETLAKTGWGPVGVPTSRSFLLDPASLPRVKTAHDMEVALGAMYRHTGKWAPGFTMPRGIPTVQISALEGAAGRYRVDENGYLFVDVDSELLSHPAAALAVLAHEACHHILDLSGFNRHDPKIDEPTADLAMFVCGFGEVFRQGHYYFQDLGPSWRRVHLGYLKADQYKFAYTWVLSGRASVPSAAQRDRAKLLNILGGNEAALERLLRAERATNAGRDEATALRAVTERLSNERR